MFLVTWKSYSSRYIRRRASHVSKDNKPKVWLTYMFGSYVYSEHVLALQFTGECPTSCELRRIDALSFHVRNSSISSGRQTVRRCWNRCRLNPQTDPTGAGNPLPLPGTHDKVNNNGMRQKSVCCIRPLRVKLGIVNMSRQLSGGPSCAPDAFIYHTDSAADLHARCGMIPYSAASNSSICSNHSNSASTHSTYFFLFHSSIP